LLVLLEAVRTVTEAAASDRRCMGGALSKLVALAHLRRDADTAFALLEEHILSRSATCRRP
jgi:hypothetical protein